MWTQCRSQPSWRVSVDWSDLSKAKDINECYVTIEKMPSLLFKVSGTRIRIHGLKSEWGTGKVQDLEDNLSRLISPFEPVRDFRIWLTPPAKAASAAEIESPPFLDFPPYTVEGNVNSQGTISLKYFYRPKQGRSRSVTKTVPWAAPRDLDEPLLTSDKPTCGPFKFEIRAWDIGQDDLKLLADRFSISKNSIRPIIKAYKGISLYRDRILVLPKSETARDWLGLDLRRVSKVGTRMSTTQIVGYVSISSKNNPAIQDTSDRERLVTNFAVQDFQKLLKDIVAQMEIERDQDRESITGEPPLRELFAGLSASKLVADVKGALEQASDAEEALPLLDQFEKDFESAKEQIQRRFVYYSRLATIGTIAQMLVHEIGNKTMVVDGFIRAARQFIEETKGTNKELLNHCGVATKALESMVQLADRFSPLANRSFQRRKRSSIVQEVFKDYMLARKDVIERHQVSLKCLPVDLETQVDVDPGELFAIILNLMDNAIFWLCQSPGSKDRKIELRVSPRKDSRVDVEISDNGPGIPNGEEERIFWPGVTRKPNGIGMGLTVVSELVSEHGGKTLLIKPGELAGATFRFDLPASTTRSDR